MTPRRFSLLFALLALAGAPLPAPAQTLSPPPPDDPAMSTLVEGLEVVARAPGPALWRVSSGDSQLVIMGTVVPVRHLLAWDSTRLAREMSGAKQVLVPGKATANPIVMTRLVLGGALKASTPLKDRLPPDLMGRFAADAAATKTSVSKYDKWKPAMAGVALLGDFDEAAGLSRAKPVSTVTKLAKSLKVPVRPMTKIDLNGFMHDAAKLDAAGHLACLDVALSDLERNAGQPGVMGAAWAAGDLRTVNRMYPAPEGCPLLNPVVSKQVDETTAALQQAMKGGGKTIALVDMTLLLRPDGVLDRLAATGAHIDTP